MWLVVSERVLLILRENSADFLRPRESVESYVFGLLVGSSRDWRRRCAAHRSGFEFSGSVIAREMGGKEGP